MLIIDTFIWYLLVQLLACTLAWWIRRIKSHKCLIPQNLWLNWSNITEQLIPTFPARLHIYKKSKKKKQKKTTYISIDNKEVSWLCWRAGPWRGRILWNCSEIAPVKARQKGASEEALTRRDRRKLPVCLHIKNRSWKDSDGSFYQWKHR